MSPQLFRSRWLIAPALFLAFCSKGNSPSVIGPSAAPVGVAEDGAVGASAAGDVKVGTGTLEFLNLAIWGFKGDSGAGGFASPGGTYGMTPGVAVRLWATYPPGSPANPKFRVDWGDGAVDAGGCGACSATHTYARPGLYTVKASLDDRVSTMVIRTFQLDARSTPIPTPIPTASATSFVYSQTFAANESYFAGSSQWDSWPAFTASLNTGAHTFTSVAFSGSNDPAVFTCSTAAIVAQIADALRGNTLLNVSCDGHIWAVNNCNSGPSMGIDTSHSCSSCADRYALRPQIGNANWGGFNSPSCNSGPTQTLTLTFLGTP